MYKECMKRNSLFQSYIFHSLADLLFLVQMLTPSLFRSLLKLNSSRWATWNWSTLPAASASAEQLAPRAQWGASGTCAEQPTAAKRVQGDPWFWVIHEQCWNNNRYKTVTMQNHKAQVGLDGQYKYGKYVWKNCSFKLLSCVNLQSISKALICNSFIWKRKTLYCVDQTFF